MRIVVNVFMFYPFIIYLSWFCFQFPFPKSDYGKWPFVFTEGFIFSRKPENSFRFHPIWADFPLGTPFLRSIFFIQNPAKQALASGRSQYTDAFCRVSAVPHNRKRPLRSRTEQGADKRPGSPHSRVWPFGWNTATCGRSTAAH